MTSELKALRDALRRILEAFDSGDYESPWHELNAMEGDGTLAAARAVLASGDIPQPKVGDRVRLSASTNDVHSGVVVDDERWVYCEMGPAKARQAWPLSALTVLGPVDDQPDEEGQR